MIRKTLENTKKATFAVLLPNRNKAGLPSPIGTGFFISPDGWFITAAHVVTENNQSNGKQRSDIDKGYLQKENRKNIDIGEGCQFFKIDFIIPNLDFALLKVDLEKNRTKEWMKDRTEFPYIKVSGRLLDEAEPVYSFGYPLSSSDLIINESIIVGSTSLSPRTTSAIVSSTIEQTKMISTPNDPQLYVLDRALNYGNSGGPIISTETGNVHAFCSRFQPQHIPQSHLKDKEGNTFSIMSPSLYGIVISLNNRDILKELKKRDILITEEKASI